jgi:UDP-N-acetylmuramoyl-tripeptide--D-alanyl-D-alanine ligase
MLSKILQKYLKFWAKKYLTRAKSKIVAITGSVGKTSTKEAVFAVLSEAYGTNVNKSYGNLNSEAGVPLAILGFKESPTKIYQWLPIIFQAPIASISQKAYKILVLEFAADKPGDIKYLSSIARPDIAIVTAIGPSHLAAFGEISKIVEEKISLLWALPKDGWAVLNLDDENVRKASYGGRWHKLTYAIDQAADITASNLQTQLDGTKVTTSFSFSGQVKIDIAQENLGGKATVYASLAAAAVGKILEISPAKIAQGLSKIKNEKHRMLVMPGINGSTIIDDSYNANPLSMRNALAVLKSLKAKRKIAVIGDMREIGKITNEAHTQIGQEAAQIADLVVAVGDEAKKYNGQKYFKDRQKAIDYLAKEVTTGDMVLVKASRGIGLDKIVDAIKLN